MYSGSVAVGQRFEAAVSSAVHLYFDDQKKEVVSPIPRNAIEDRRALAHRFD